MNYVLTKGQPVYFWKRNSADIFTTIFAGESEDSYYGETTSYAKEYFVAFPVLRIAQQHALAYLKEEATKAFDRLLFYAKNTLTKP